jgi:hypothetical protein
MISCFNLIYSQILYKLSNLFNLIFNSLLYLSCLISSISSSFVFLNKISLIVFLELCSFAIFSNSFLFFIISLSKFLLNTKTDTSSLKGTVHLNSLTSFKIFQYIFSGFVKFVQYFNTLFSRKFIQNMFQLTSFASIIQSVYQTIISLCSNFISLILTEEELFIILTHKANHQAITFSNTQESFLYKKMGKCHAQIIFNEFFT